MLCAIWYIFSHTQNTPFSIFLKLSFKSHFIVRFEPLAVVKLLFWGCWTRLDNIFWRILLLLFIVGVYFPRPFHRVVMPRRGSAKPKGRPRLPGLAKLIRVRGLVFIASTSRAGTDDNENDGKQLSLLWLVDSKNLLKHFCLFICFCYRSYDLDVNASSWSRGSSFCSSINECKNTSVDCIIIKQVHVHATQHFCPKTN